MRQGDIVAYAHKGTTNYCKIVRWSGDPDTRPLLLDREGRTYRPYADSTVRIDGDVARAFRLEIDALEFSKKGQEALKTSAMRATAVEIKGRRTIVDRGHMTKEGADPSHGPGQLDRTQEPMVLTEGFTSNPTSTFTAYLDGSPGEERRMMRAMQALATYSPRYRDALNGGGVAARLGVSAGNARVIRHRARAWCRAWIAADVEKKNAAEEVQR